MVMGREGTLVKAKNFEQITVDDTAGGKGLTSSEYTGSLFAKVQVETAEIRYTEDGTAPTTTVGHIGSVYDIIYVSFQDFATFKAIRTGTTSGKLNITYFK